MAKPSLPLPLIIAHQLSLYFASCVLPPPSPSLPLAHPLTPLPSRPSCKRRNLLESIGPAGFNALNASVAQLVECFTTCDSMAKVGVPAVYGIHLKQATSAFLFTLPLVLVELMGFAVRRPLSSLVLPSLVLSTLFSFPAHAQSCHSLVDPPRR